MLFFSFFCLFRVVFSPAKLPLFSQTRCQNNTFLCKNSPKQHLFHHLFCTMPSIESMNYMKYAVYGRHIWRKVWRIRLFFVILPANKHYFPFSFMEYLSWHGVTMDKTWEFMQPTSVKRLQDILTGVGQKVTRETVNSFLQYLHDAY